MHSTLYTFSLSAGHNEITLTHPLQKCVGVTLLGYESVSKNIFVHFEDLPINAECYVGQGDHRSRTIYLPNSSSLPLAGPIAWRFDHPQVFPQVFRCNILDAASGTPITGLNSTNRVTLTLMVECMDY